MSGQLSPAEATAYIAAPEGKLPRLPAALPRPGRRRDRQPAPARVRDVISWMLRDPDSTDEDVFSGGSAHSELSNMRIAENAVIPTASRGARDISDMAQLTVTATIATSGPSHSYTGTQHPQFGRPAARPATVTV